LQPEECPLETVFFEEPVWIHRDRGNLKQVLTDLTLNARRASSAGNRILIATSRVKMVSKREMAATDEPPSPLVRLSVRDWGCGMDAAIREHIFEPLFTTKDVGHGSGLEPAVTFGIVRRRGGWIEVESGPGSGTEFALFLPRAFWSATTISYGSPLPSRSCWPRCPRRCRCRWAQQPALNRTLPPS
jgi:signal transduction histidine kinase